MATALGALACLLAATPVQADPGWTAPAQLDAAVANGSFSYYTGQIVPLSNGSAFAVWVGSNGTGSDFVYASFYVPGSGWSVAQNLTLPGGVDDPQAAADSDGNIIVTYRPSSASRIYAVRYEAGVGWGGVEQVSQTPPSPTTSTIVYDQVIAFDGAGNALCAWNEWERTTDNRSVWANRFTPAGGWGTPELLEPKEVSSSSEDVSLGVDDAGNGLAIWSRRVNTTREWRWNRFTPAGGWSGFQTIPPVGEDYTYWAPLVAVRPDGSATVAGGNGTGIYTSDYSSSTGWSAPQLAAPGNAREMNAFVSNPAGAEAVSWIQINSSRQELWAAVREAGGAWQEPVMLTITTARPIRGLAIDDQGRVTAGWIQNNASGGFMLAQRYLPGRGWAQPRVVDGPGGTTIGGNAIAASPDGYAYAFWGLSFPPWKPMGSVFVPDTTGPSVDAGGDVSLTIGDSAMFNGSATDDDPLFPRGSNASWSFDYNGAPQEFAGMSFSFTFNDLGVYMVTLFVTDEEGNVGSDTVQVYVSPPDTTAPTVDAGPDNVSLVWDFVHFQGTATDNDPGFSTTGQTWWTFTYNGSTVNQSGSSFDFVFAAAGTYTMTFWARDAWGNTASDTLVAEVSMPDTSPPTVDAGPDLTALTGQGVDFEAQVVSPDPRFPLGATFEWQFDDGAVPVVLPGNPASYVFNTEGTVVVTLDVTDRWGNEVSDTLQVTVVGPDTEPPQVTAIPDVEVHVGDPVEVTAVATDNSAQFAQLANYTWTFHAGGQDHTVYGNPFTFTFVESADVVVTLVVRDGRLNPSDPVQFTVAVSVPDIEPPVVQATANRTAVEAGSSVSFHGNATDGGKAVTADSAFSWNITEGGNTTTLHGREVTYLFTVPGPVTVRLEVTDPAGNVGYQEITVDVSQAAPPPGDDGSSGSTPGPGVLAGVAAVGVAAIVWGRRRR